jgi:hypothetical protein
VFARPRRESFVFKHFLKIKTGGTLPFIERKLKKKKKKRRKEFRMAHGIMYVETRHMGI